MTEHRYALWLMPSGQWEARLADVIARLAAQYDSPVFAPHLTLLGGLSGDPQMLERRTGQLAAALEPFEVELAQVDASEAYHRCVFVKARPDEALLHARHRAEALFGSRPAAEFLPHVSLLYGNLPAAERDRLKQRLGGEFAGSFSAEALALVDTTGDTDAWREVLRCALAR